MGIDAYQAWLDELQEAYEAYADLTGSCPYNGDVINIINTEEPYIQQYGAVAGNPIRTNFNQINNFKNYAEQGYMNFGDLHEIGHDFDIKESFSKFYHLKHLENFYRYCSRTTIQQGMK
ncbi:MAG: hypothetical protein IJA36_07495 [Lachnospiraceae bacterium]|nr:hypothetical protein [Lachnospiraceae bacterium]